MARILVIEDEKDLQGILDYNLRRAGHAVVAAFTGEEGLRLARESPPDVVLLDRMLPDMAGTTVCRTIKQDPYLRGSLVVFLTAKGEEADRVLGFELGAADYVVKPFSVRELVLRIGALLRRTTPRREPDEVHEHGSVKVARYAHRVWVEDQEVDLTAIEFRLLVTLIDRAGRVQSRRTLLRDVWGTEVGSGIRTVDTHVRRLREKLRSAGPLVETVRNAGYRFGDGATLF